MKKIIVVLIIGILFVTGCEEKEKTETYYIKDSFIEANWTRNIGNDI